MKTRNSRTRTKTTTLCLLMLALGCLSALAQDKAVSLGKITGGGGVSTGSRFGATGSIGQPDATMQKSAGLRFGVAGGFHAAVIALQTPGGPMLSVKVEGGMVTVSWPEAITGWKLQQTTALATMASWQDSTGVANNSVTIPMPTGTTYFRLSRTQP